MGEGLLLLFPEFGHVFEGLTLGFGNELPDEEGCKDADNAIEAVGEPVAEVIAWSEVHIEHRHEGGGDDEVEDPLEGNGDGNGCSTNGVGEDLGNEYPADRPP